jgi:hypothetical protein
MIIIGENRPKMQVHIRLVDHFGINPIDGIHTALKIVAALGELPGQTRKKPLDKGKRGL